MKNYLNTLLTASIFISFYSHGQELSDSVIQNLTSEQIDVAREVLENNQSKVQVVEIINDDTEESLKDKEEEEKSIIPNPMFGYNFISSSPTSITATGDLPLPNDYQLSIGDVIGVILSGSINQIFDMEVQLDGTVFFPELGSISVAGESFAEVKNKFKNIINQTYIGVNINLSLKDLAAKKITIVGTVNNPGTYLVNPFTTISNALSYSGGVSPIGSLRTIRLIRVNGDIYNFDLYDLLINGDRTTDITIESGDVIIVDAATKFIEISGMVKRPGGYEILPGENLSNILNFALGFVGGANISKITLDKLNLETYTVSKVTTDDLNYQLDNVLSIKVYPLINNNEYNIYVNGAIKEPGYYSIKNYPLLEDLINSLEFVNVYPWLGVLEQFDKDNLIKTTRLFSLKDVSTYKDITLLPNSKLYFANLNSRIFNVNEITKRLIEDYSLVINHNNMSYSLPVYGRYSVNSFIEYLGLDMNDVNAEATYISPLDNNVINDDYKTMEFNAKKFNTISFRSPVNDLIKVSVSGAVDYPGVYTMQPNSTIDDLYNLVGNFKSEAFESGIIFTRESIRERQLKSIQKSKEDLNRSLLIMSQKGANVDASVVNLLTETIDPENLGRIAGDFSPGSISAIKTVLLDGDNLIIPKNPNAVNVLGEVLNPTAFEFTRGMKVRTAIDNAGGYQDYANKNKVYIIKANGTITKAKRNIFLGNVSLEAGDTIVVPRKIITNNPGIDALLPITQILSDLAFSAAALETLSNK